MLGTQIRPSISAVYGNKFFININRIIINARALHNYIKTYNFVIPCKRSATRNPVLSSVSWIPAFAGMTIREIVQRSQCFDEKVHYFGEKFPQTAEDEPDKRHLYGYSAPKTANSINIFI